MSSDAYNAAEAGSPMSIINPIAPCPFRLGKIGIIPVRYSVDGVNENNEPYYPLPSKGQWSPFFKVEHSTYTLRQLRDGWVYVYSKNQEALLEYEVVGTQFIQSSGSALSCLIFDTNDTIQLVYSHQQWTQRLITLFTDDSKLRQQWMRSLNIQSFSRSLKAPHTGMANDLELAVADIGQSTPEITNVFSWSCTTLEAKNEVDETRFIATKSVSAAVNFQASLPSLIDGLFIALDDPLADISDLYLKLSQDVINRANIVGDEDNRHKLQMAEITRHLGRVTLEANEVPSCIQSEPLKVMALEKMLTEYANVLSLSAYESNLPATEQVGYTPIYSLKKAALKQRLEDEYNFNVTEEQIKRWTEHSVFSDEVNWTELDEFLTKYYSKIQSVDKRIAAHFDDAITVIKQLGNDPIAIGLDNQDKVHQSYLLTLTCPLLVLLRQSASTDAQITLLNTTLSLDDTTDNLLALSSMGFSVQNLEALDNYVQSLGGGGALSTSASGDMVAFWGSIANADAFVGDGRIQDTKWFKSLMEPVKNSFVALFDAISDGAADSWHGTMDLLFPSQYITTSSRLSILGNLRLILIESIVNEKTILMRNPDYEKQIQAFNKKLKVLLLKLENVTNIKLGHVSPKNHQIGLVKETQKQLQQLFTSELPMLILLKDKATNETARQLMNENLKLFGKQAKNVSASLGGLGGVVALLNIWNVSLVSENIAFKIQQSSNTHPWINPALREVLYATGYAVSAASAVLRDKKWAGVVINRDILNNSLKEFINDNPTQKGIAKTFSKHVLITALFGCIASGLEAWESYDKWSDTSLDSTERVGYGLKMVATGAQGLTFFAQIILRELSVRGLLGVSVGSILASWMFSAFAVIGIIYLIGVMIINIFKKTPLESWLKNSTWGKEPKLWNNEDEIIHLESIIHQPVISLNKVDKGKPTQWMQGVSYQWELNIILPPFTEGKVIGLQIARKLHVQQYTYNRDNNQSKILINEQEGKWTINKEGAPMYSLLLGGSDKDTVAMVLKMPLNWIGDENYLCYLAASYGDRINIERSDKEKEYGSRALIVGVNNNGN